MSPLDFVDWLGSQWRLAGIRAVVTSGQACVHYGIQLSTKDSDWIVQPDDLATLCSTLAEWDERPDMEVRFRSLCGAPLEANFLRHGWTSHVEVVEGGREHRIDLFGKAPRVQCTETDQDNAQYASRHVVAQMKKTDREKDWPIVFGLGRQMIEREDWRGVLHLQDAATLQNVWPSVPIQKHAELVHQRPLLALANGSPGMLRRAIAVERSIWIAVNRLRYRRYQLAWKEFYRAWRSEPEMQWPLDQPFLAQHLALLEAAARFQLPEKPLGPVDGPTLLELALLDVKEIMAATDAEIGRIVPPLGALLP